MSFLGRKGFLPTLENLIGQRVAVSYDGYQSAGQHKLTWKAVDYASGTYMVKMTNGEKSQTARVTLLK